MQPYPNQTPRRFTGFLILLLLPALTACQSTIEPDPPANTTARITTIAAQPQALGQPGGMPMRVLALIEDDVVRPDYLMPALLEIAGNTALNEYLLDRQLQAVCDEQGIRITERDVAAERILLTQAFETDAQTDPDQAARLLAQLRENRGLGPHRFDALLRRNAQLRKLVGPDVEVTPAMRAQARDLRFGPRATFRVITTTSLEDAATARERILRGDAFAEVAALLSTDASAERGGLMGPIALADPAFPQAIRDAARTLDPAEVSQTIVLDEGFAIVQLIERTTPNQPNVPEADLDQLIQRDARLRQERLLMDRMARALLAEVRPDIIDESLRFSWEAAGN